MEKLLEKICAYKDDRIALYGLGTETEKAISVLGEEFEIFGLLDGFKESGEIYGKSIVSLTEAIGAQIKLIVVVARPGSCKAIRRRIGEVCRKNGVALVDVRGNDLLVEQKVTYHWKDLEAMEEALLWEKVQRAEAVSFDLFDTLITRLVYSYTDLFELISNQLLEKNIGISDFARKRLAAEKELSKDGAPRLEMIYEKILQGEGKVCAEVTPQRLAQMEWELEKTVLVPREKMVKIFDRMVALGKAVYIITDTYYRRAQIEEVLKLFHIKGYRDVLVSCECGVSKTSGLYEVYLKGKRAGSCLHIGDDEKADIECAKVYGVETFRVYSGADLFESIGALGLEPVISSLSDRVKMGMFVARLFNNPFCFETKNRRLELQSAYDIGYLVCAPMITDFVLWMDEITAKRRIEEIWLCARDGYMIQKMYELLKTEKKAVYFLTSRTAAIRAGVESKKDVEYVDGMKFFGTPEESLRARFGLEASEKEADEKENGLLKYADIILEKAREQRKYYQQYIESRSCSAEEVAVFDFVAKGTTQMYLQKIVKSHLQGFYFLQLEPEFMSDKGLDIEPFYSDAEKNESAIFDHYYILETILTAPHASVLEFAPGGIAVYAQETRCERDIQCFGRAQEGILDYFKTFIELVPKELRVENKKLDESLLALVSKLRITDSDFLALTVEDPFFNRMTDIQDVLE